MEDYRNAKSYYGKAIRAKFKCDEIEKMIIDCNEKLYGMKSSENAR